MGTSHQSCYGPWGLLLLALFLDAQRDELQHRELGPLVVGLELNLLAMAVTVGELLNSVAKMVGLSE